MKKTNFKVIALIIATIIAITALTACTSNKSTSPTTTGNSKVKIEMEGGGTMVLELYPNYAPETVANFLSLVDKGFYNGITFHRIIKDFMIQGGDPSGNGSGGSDKNIKGEFANNGFTQNTLKHTKGVISMARSGDPDSASSQFFIMHGEVSQLDGDYAAFGKLIEGEDILDKIASSPVHFGENSADSQPSTPDSPVVIKTISIVKD
jgi:peptidyl-prolyl cis-trans isomerase B (cyclophilin B)